MPLVQVIRLSSTDGFPKFMARYLDLKFWTPRNRWKRFFVAPISETRTSVPYYYFQKVTFHRLEMFGSIIGGMSLKLTMSRVFQGSEILRHLHVCVCVFVFEIRHAKGSEYDVHCFTCKRELCWLKTCVVSFHGFLFGLCHFPVQNQIVCFRLETTCWGTSPEFALRKIPCHYVPWDKHPDGFFSVTWQVPKCFPNLIRAHNMSLDVWFYV